MSDNTVIKVRLVDGIIKVQGKGGGGIGGIRLPPIVVPPPPPFPDPDGNPNCWACDPETGPTSILRIPVFDDDGRDPEDPAWVPTYAPCGSGTYNSSSDLDCCQESTGGWVNRDTQSPGYKISCDPNCGSKESICGTSSVNGLNILNCPGMFCSPYCGNDPCSVPECATFCNGAWCLSDGSCVEGSATDEVNDALAQFTAGGTCSRFAFNALTSGGGTPTENSNFVNCATPTPTPTPTITPTPPETYNVNMLFVTPTPI